MVRLGTWLRWASLAIAVLIAIVAAAPFLVPLDRFIPELERVASARLGQPVVITRLELHLAPTPRAAAFGIRVGRKDEVAIGELEIVPDLLSFLSGPRSIRLIRAEGVALKEAALAIPESLPRGEDGEPLLVRRLQLKGVKLEHSKLRLPEFDLDAELGEGFALELAWLETRDRTLSLMVDPGPGGLAKIELAASQWTLPAGAPLSFESLAVHGTLRAGRLDLAAIEGSLYGGTISGSASIEWSKQWLVSGKATLAEVDLAPLQRAFGKTPRLSGRLKTDAAFSARARVPEQLLEALSLDGPFEVLGGAYQGVDLAKAGELAGSSAPEDATQFQQLQGRLELRGKRVRISELCVRSPKIVAGGNIEVAPDQALSGRLDVSVAQTGGFLGVPVTLSGTTSEPVTRPTRGYLIGAAIGTVLLPGIGTSIGSSLGGRLEGGSGCN